MKHPPIIHVGYFKTGTTWFQQTFFPSVKNIAFNNSANSALDSYVSIIGPFDFDADYCKKNIEFHLRGFSNKKMLLSRERLSGHPFTGGYDARVISDRLKEMYPKALIVVFIREQVSAIESTYKEYVKRGGTYSVDQWLYGESRTIPSFSINYFQYHKQIEYYYKLFGKDHVLVYCYEDFKKDKKEFLENMMTDLDLELSESDFSETRYINKGFSSFTTECIRIANKFSQNKNLNPCPAFKIPFLRKFTQTFCQNLEKIKKNNRKQKSVIDVRTREYLKDYYRESNAKLSNLLQRNLSELGYSVRLNDTSE